MNAPTTANATPKELGKPVTTPCQLSRIRFSPCGKLLALAGHDGSIIRWEIDDGTPKPIAPLTGHHGWVSDLSFHSDRKRLFSADSWGRLCAWDYAAGKKIWEHDQAHDGWVRAITLTPDGQLLVSSGRDGVIRAWNTQDGKRRFECLIGGDLQSLTCHPQTGALAVGDSFGKILEVALEGRTPLRTLECAEFHILDRIQDVGGIRRLLFSPDGQTLFAAGCAPKSGGFVQGFPLLLALDWKSGKEHARWKGAAENEGFVQDIRYHPDGYVMAVTSGQPGSGKLIFWKPKDAAPSFTTTKMPNCHSLDIHPDLSRLAVSATNANSSGNGRLKGQGGEYPANHSPIYFWQMPATKS